VCQEDPSEADRRGNRVGVPGARRYRLQLQAAPPNEALVRHEVADVTAVRLVGLTQPPVLPGVSNRSVRRW
jgi:hypothetical protein